MKTLKQEEVCLANYETYLDVLENLPSFIGEVYNEKRAHSGIDYLTPSELEEKTGALHHLEQRLFHHAQRNLNANALVVVVASEFLRLA